MIPKKRICLFVLTAPNYAYLAIRMKGLRLLMTIITACYNNIIQKTRAKYSLNLFLISNDNAIVEKGNNNLSRRQKENI